MAKFKCVHTGNVVEFETEHDIVTMRKHEEYTEVVETSQEVKPSTTKKVKQDATSISGNDTNNGN
jgi:hypothetical protein